MRLPSVTRFKTAKASRPRNSQSKSTFALAAASHFVVRSFLLPSGGAVGCELPLLPAQEQRGLEHAEGGGRGVERLYDVDAALLGGDPHPHRCIVGTRHDMLCVAVQGEYISDLHSA